jgi:hypothetical protein
MDEMEANQASEGKRKEKAMDGLKVPMGRSLGRPVNHMGSEELLIS